MSFSFTVVKDSDGLRLDMPNLHQALPYIPDGVYMVGGHHVLAGETGSESLSVSLSAAEGGYFSANVSMPISRPPAAVAGVEASVAADVTAEVPPLVA